VKLLWVLLATAGLDDAEDESMIMPAMIGSDGYA
jgi:hypothetical protein